MKAFLISFAIFLACMIITYGGVHLLFPDHPVHEGVLFFSCFFASGTTGAIIPNLWAVFVRGE